MSASVRNNRVYLVNKHNVIRTGTEGNGFHGVCKYCGAALVTDLGYCSYDGLKCVDRLPTSVRDFPENIRSYIDFKGFRFNKEKQIFSRAYDNKRYTVNMIFKIVKNLSV